MSPARFAHGDGPASSTFAPNKPTSTEKTNCCSTTSALPVNTSGHGGAGNPLQRHIAAPSDSRIHNLWRQSIHAAVSTAVLSMAPSEAISETPGHIMRSGPGRLSSPKRPTTKRPMGSLLPDGPCRPEPIGSERTTAQKRDAHRRSRHRHLPNLHGGQRPRSNTPTSPTSASASSQTRASTAVGRFGRVGRARTVDAITTTAERCPDHRLLFPGYPPARTSCGALLFATPANFAPLITLCGTHQTSAGALRITTKGYTTAPRGVLLPTEESIRDQLCPVPSLLEGFKLNQKKAGASARPGFDRQTKSSPSLQGTTR